MIMMKFRVTFLVKSKQYRRNGKKVRTVKIKFSFANLLNWYRPLVVVDEAHNAKTPDLRFKVLGGVNAAFVLLNMLLLLQK